MAQHHPSGQEARSGLEPWAVGELPAPPLSSGTRILGVIGPGAIILGLSIGSGEWLLGPATFVKYGMSLLWITSVAAFLQTVFNTEVIRYTLYTGEPAFSGFMRTRPGARFWGWFYAALYFLQVGWPAWAGAAAASLFLLVLGRMPGVGDGTTLYAIGIATFLVCVAILLVGRRIERTLEILNWVLIAFVFGGLALLCIGLTPASRWLAAAAGFVGYDVDSGRFALLPEGADWFLLSAFAAYSGAGGVGNLTLGNWARDKGFGMGHVVGYIPAAAGGQVVRLAHTGTVFPVHPESLRRWRGWWRIVRVDQWGVFFVGALLGMALPGILYTSFLPRGRDIRGPSIAAELANAVGSHAGTALTLCIAFMGAWILFKTQLDCLEGMVRSLTDILWTASRRVRRLRHGDVRRVYYGVLAVVVVWALFAMRLTQPIVLLQIGANIAGVVFVISSIHLLRVNTTLLPAELRPPLWRRVALAATAGFYGFLVYLWLAGGLVPDPARGFLFQLPHLLKAA